MGTGASMSVSLVHEGQLWGLVSCHTVQPRRLPYHVRTACEFMGQILSLQIALKERARAIEERVARRSVLVKLLGAWPATRTSWLRCARMKPACCR
jgi:light-regulated signal transduction histidine kinase (bacteriophytochrome)